MIALAERILEVVREQPGITDKRLAETLFGSGTRQQRVNGECRLMVARGLIQRAARPDGLIGNYGAGRAPDPQAPTAALSAVSAGGVFSEDRVKSLLEAWLKANGWTVEVRWARSRGIDLHARRGNERWIIEAKGAGSLDPMRLNYFLGVLGETLQRMDDPHAAYSIALPDLKQFRNLWLRLPQLAKQRTGITAIFVSEEGRVDHLGTSL